MLGSLRRHCRRLLVSSRPGATMIEVAIGITVLGFVVGAIAPAMVLNVKQQTWHDDERIAENLTRAQLEYIKSQDYVWGNETWPVVYDVVVPDVRYGIDVDINPIDPDTHEPLAPGEDEGLQQITVTAYGYALDPDDPLGYLLSTIDYKVARSLQIQGYQVDPVGG